MLETAFTQRQPGHRRRGCRRGAGPQAIRYQGAERDQYAAQHTRVQDARYPGSPHTPHANLRFLPIVGDSPPAKARELVNLRPSSSLIEGYAMSVIREADVIASV